MYYKRNLWNAQRTALIPVNELLGKLCVDTMYSRTIEII